MKTEWELSEYINDAMWIYAVILCTQKTGFTRQYPCHWRPDATKAYFSGDRERHIVSQSRHLHSYVAFLHAS